MLIIIDDCHGCVYFNRKEVLLTKMEFRYYNLLSKNKGQALPPERVIEHIWPGRREVTSQNNLSQLSFKLKRKFQHANVSIVMTSSLKSGCTFSYEKKMFTLRVNNKILSNILRRVYLK